MDNFHYFGLFLDTNTKNKLMNILTDNIDYNIALNVADKIFIDHCTLLHVSQLHGYSEVFNDLNNRLGENIQIKIEGIGISDKAMAFKVVLPKNVYSINRTPHITICTFNGGKPVESNNITKWLLLEEPIQVKTTLKKD